MAKPGFQPGKSGNPNGRPKKQNTFTQILEELGNLKDVTSNGQKIERKQALGEALWQKAIVEKDLGAIKYIYDRVDGQPIAMQQLSGDGEDRIMKIEWVLPEGIKK